MSFQWRRTARLLSEERGATAVEYALIVAVMTLAVVGALASTGDANKEKWDNVAGDITSAHESVR